jgi:hypothetical protein
MSPGSAAPGDLLARSNDRKGTQADARSLLLLLQALSGFKTAGHH